MAEHLIFRCALPHDARRRPHLTHSLEPMTLRSRRVTILAVHAFAALLYSTQSSQRYEYPVTVEFKGGRQTATFSAASDGAAAEQARPAACGPLQMANSAGQRPAGRSPGLLAAAPSLAAEKVAVWRPPLELSVTRSCVAEPRGSPPCGSARVLEGMGWCSRRRACTRTGNIRVFGHNAKEPDAVVERSLQSGSIPADLDVRALNGFPDPKSG